jgi:hypothetical protein
MPQGVSVIASLVASREIPLFAKSRSSYAPGVGDPDAPLGDAVARVRDGQASALQRAEHRADGRGG